MGDDAVRILQEQIKGMQISMQGNIEGLRRDINDGMRETREKIDDINEAYNMRLSKIEKRCASRQHVVDAHEKMMEGRASSDGSREEWLNARIGRWVMGLASGAAGAAIGAAVTVAVKGVIG